MKTITATNANRHFQKVLREVSRGEVFTVLSRGKKVASIVPASQEAERRRESAKHSLLKRLAGEKMVLGVSWNRDELYDR